MAFGDLLGGTPARTQQFPLMSPQQMGLQNQSIQQAMSLLQNLGQQPQGGGFAPIAQQARQQFQTQTIPSIAERFSNLGAQKSSAFQGALGSAASGLESNLAALGSQYGLQERGQQQDLLRSLLSVGTQRPFETAYFPRQPGFGENLLSGLGGGLGYGASTFLPQAMGGLSSILPLLLQLLGGR